MDATLIVRYGPAGYMAAKGEIHAILTKIGDQKEEVDLLVPGIVGVKTKLAARKVVEEARELYVSNPEQFRATLKWQPADNWCESTVDAIKKMFKEEIQDLMTPDDTYIMEINLHRSMLQGDAIVSAIAPLLKGKMDYERPQKIVSLEVFEKETCVSLHKVKDVFVRE